MTEAQPPARRPDPTTGPAAPADPEQVLAQALRAMAGGPRADSPGSGASGEPAAERAEQVRRTGWTTAQVILLAAVIGLALGVIAGLMSLVLG